MGKNLPAVRQSWVRSLGWEDPLEEGTATHSNILAWRTPWTEESGRLQSMGLQSKAARGKVMVSSSVFGVLTGFSSKESAC